MGRERLVTFSGFSAFTGIPCAGEFFGAVKTLPALPAAVRPKREQKQDPELQNAPALCAMHMRAAAKRTGFLRLINKKSKNTFHPEGMIPLRVTRRNPATHNRHRLYSMAALFDALLLFRSWGLKSRSPKS
jgi:hypothetical protein